MITVNREQHVLKICKQVLNHIEPKYIILGSPDKIERNKKAVDFNGIIRGTEFFLEHTLIESYPHQIEDEKQIEFLFCLEEELNGKLPSPGHYDLVLVPKALKGFKDKKSIKHILKKWIVESAKKLELGSPNTAPNHFLREVPIGLSFEVTLYRFPRNDSKLFISRYKSETLESERFERIKTAILEKCPKLRTSKKNKNDLSILVLESNDIGLSNHILIGNSLIKVFSKIDKKLIPEKIFLVETHIKKFNIFIFKKNQFIYLD